MPLCPQNEQRTRIWAETKFRVPWNSSTDVDGIQKHDGIQTFPLIYAYFRHHPITVHWSWLPSETNIPSDCQRSAFFLICPRWSVVDAKLAYEREPNRSGVHRHKGDHRQEQ